MRVKAAGPAWAMAIKRHGIHQKDCTFYPANI
jgi:hypothetical protein